MIPLSSFNPDSSFYLVSHIGPRVLLHLFFHGLPMARFIVPHQVETRCQLSWCSSITMGFHPLVHGSLIGPEWPTIVGYRMDVT